MKLLLLGTAREKSSRLANKMTRSFAGSSLYKIYLEKFEAILGVKHPFDGVGMAIWEGDKTLWKLSRGTKVPIIGRNEKSVSQGISRRSEELHFLRERVEDYVMWVNGCLPFLKPETIIEAGAYFKSVGSVKSLTAVRVKHNWYWDSRTKRPINNLDPTCVSTQGCPPLLETVHCFHIFNREYLLMNDSYWGLEDNDPYLYVLKDDWELLDIDTDFDFEYCEEVWRKTR
jgi:CMP-N-acetylneuraminic acid synthetase